MSAPSEVWVSDGLPATALEELARAERTLRMFPLIGGTTAWANPPAAGAKVAVACPNRLGVTEPLFAPGRWTQVWWWSDPLSEDCSHWSGTATQQVLASVALPAERPVAEAVDRCRRAGDYLTRRFRNLKGVRIPPVSFGRRFPLLLSVNPDSLVRGIAEELWVPRPVDGWPGLVVCEVGWWQSRDRLDALVDTVRHLAGGERPAPLDPAPRVWSSPGP